MSEPLSNAEIESRFTHHPSDASERMREAARAIEGILPLTEASS